MATYFHSNNSEIQDGAGGGGGGSSGDGLQTLVLMNPGYIQYSDTPPPPPPHAAGGNLVFLNSAAAAAAGNTSLATQNFPHVPLQSHGQQFVGIPLSMAAAGEQHEVSGLHGLGLRGQYNLWNTIDPNSAARDGTRATQGLSLSLPATSGDDVRISGGSSSSPSGVTTTNGGGVSGIQSFLLSSKYLKATQELLEEVVNVNNNNGYGVIKTEHHGKRSFEKVKVVGESSGGAASGEGSVGERGGKGGSEISATERQEIQMKKAKLISMVDEVEQRYRQYQKQMQIVISNFEQVAGIGSAKTYTWLALQTISKQFRCLKDAIAGQMKAASKSLGEEDHYCFGGSGGGSRLKYVDHHLRQQRAIQQLGMMHHPHHHHNAWRPQRGLPERSVSVLRSWLFEHFLHPYPKDSDKHTLAKQTGLTRSQVSNWFINARVRLWKPMVEEMYLEETKDHEINNNNNNGTTTSEENNKSSNKSSEDLIKGPNPQTETKSSLEASRNFHSTQSGFSFMGSSELLDGITQGTSPKKPRNHEVVVPSISNMDVKSNDASNNEHIIKFGGDHDDDDDDDRHGRDEYSFMGNQTNFISGFGQYPIEEIGGRFDAQNFTPRFSGNNNNGVSLTLGLPHCDTLSGTHNQTFLPNQNIANEFGALNTPNPHHSSAAFESINNIQNPKRFVAQLLPDFVA